MEISDLNKYQKVYLTYKIFLYWNSGKIIYNEKPFLPIQFNIIDVESILKVYLSCSKIDNDLKVDNIMNYFKRLNFFEKLDFMIYLFDIVNDINIIPNYLKDGFNLRDLSNKLLDYKLYL